MDITLIAGFFLDSHSPVTTLLHSMCAAHDTSLSNLSPIPILLSSRLGKLVITEGEEQRCTATPAVSTRSDALLLTIGEHSYGTKTPSSLLFVLLLSDPMVSTCYISRSIEQCYFLLCGGHAEARHSTSAALRSVTTVEENQIVDPLSSGFSVMLFEAEVLCLVPAVFSPYWA
ncbi:unnamed protein product [Cyclocybe aegerita]|uniref:Uncharacterized protein n=1 Tax=Cyclocybe aegerita TaxID=1973307 RepID=A0A8S0VU80_CYCAE|nr:unnamed protein product [Cyclocybe aegerita]